VSPGTGAELIKTESLTKRFGELVAVDRVNYVLRENEVAGIVGSNGAGKTTFFNLITGYYPPDGGTILYQGKDITHVSPEKRVDMGMMRTFQLTSTFDNLTVIDNLVLSFYRAHKSSSLFPLFLSTCKQYRGEERITESLETFELQNESHRQVKQLSLGEKRLIVEHKISQVEDFLERLTVMHEGRVIADGKCEECLRAPEVRRSYWQIETPADETDDARAHGVQGDE
jgi:branched-chain amino acid transport system ATP-binding protein